MTKYKAMPGVILVQICDQYLLVAATEARKVCPYYIQINDTGAFLWNLVQSEMTREEILDAVIKEYDVEQPDQIAETVDAYIDQLLSLHYVLEVS